MSSETLSLFPGFRLWLVSRTCRPAVGLCILSMYSMAATPRTLLVVDDDPSIHELVRAMLAGKRWELDSASDGGEALSRLATRAYDLVLTDILMPGMDTGLRCGRTCAIATRLRAWW